MFCSTCKCCKRSRKKDIRFSDESVSDIVTGKFFFLFLLLVNAYFFFVHMKTTSLLAALFALVAYVAAHGNFQCYQYEVTLPDDSVYEFDLYNLLADGNDVYERSTFPSGWLTYNADGYLWAFSAATLSCMDDPNYISVCNGGSVCRFQENATSSPTVLAEDLSYSAIYG